MRKTRKRMMNRILTTINFKRALKLKRMNRPNFRNAVQRSRKMLVTTRKTTKASVIYIRTQEAPRSSIKKTTMKAHEKRRDCHTKTKCLAKNSKSRCKP